MAIIINGRGRVGARVTSGGGAPSYDSDAQAFFTAASITDPTQMGAVNTLVTGLKSNNLWTKIKALYPVVGGNATAHSKNLKNPSQYNLTFSSGWTHSSAGMLPTNAYADTGIIFNNIYTINDVHLSVYTTTNSNGLFCDLSDSVSNIYSRFTGSSYMNINSSNYNIDVVSDSLGYYLVSRTGATVQKSFKNGSILSATSISSVSMSTISLKIGCYGNLSQYSNRNQITITNGYGLSDSEATILSTIVNTFNTTLGRNTY